MVSITLLTSAGAVRVAGDNLVIDIRDISETPATSSQPVTAPGRMNSSPSVRDTHSAPSKAETGRAGGPVCAPVANQEHAGCRDDRHDLAADAGSRVRSGLGIGNAGWNSTVRNRGQSTPKPLRPHCINPELCRSGTREHCHSCRKQMAESEAA